MHASWVPVEKSMLSRVLYPNPVCLLSVRRSTDGNEDDGSHDKRQANVMTITWLTPINNQGGFLCSVNSNRYTAKYLQAPGSIFVLNVPVRGMEELVLAIGGCSGANIDKFENLTIATCAPGGRALTAEAAPSGDAQPIKTKKLKLSKQELAKQAIAVAASKCVAIQGCAAHVLCRVETIQADDGHYILRCTQMAAWCREDYWDGKNFIPKSPSSEPYLTFLGSQVFGYVLPGSRV
ncbi:putative Phosphatidylinositide phosphatase sac1like protein, partial [Globisporangium splendens]